VRYLCLKFVSMVFVALFLSIFVAGCSATGGSDERSITSFGFEASLNETLSEDIVGVISGTGITATLPEGSDPSALIATFEGVGTDIAIDGQTQTSGVTVNDFTNPLTYTVTAGDGSTTDYAVLITVESGGGGDAVVIAYVDGVGGSDDGDGSDANPYATISKGIEALTESGGEVRVARGVYRVSSSIDLVDGVSLYGGYDAEDWSRNIQSNTTMIMDTRTSGGAALAPISVIKGVGEIGGTTVIDGFTISAALGADVLSDSVAAIFLKEGASPTILNNIINGGSGSRSYGLFLNRVNPMIDGNEINGCAASGSVEISVSVAIIYASGSVIDNIITACDRGDRSYGIAMNQYNGFILQNTIDGGGGDISVGIQVEDHSNPIIDNNVIDGGDGDTSSYGLLSDVSSPVISNNTISGGSNPNANAIRLDTSSGSEDEEAVVISNNIIFLPSVAGYGIYEVKDITRAPSILQNNDIFHVDDNDTGVLYHRVTLNPEDDNYTSIGAMQEALNGAGHDVSGNMEVDLVLDSEFRITTEPDPVSVTEGGLDLSSPSGSQVSVLLDRDGNPRSVPYSIGAYEYD